PLPRSEGRGDGWSRVALRLLGGVPAWEFSRNTSANTRRGCPPQPLQAGKGLWLVDGRRAVVAGWSAWSEMCPARYLHCSPICILHSPMCAGERSACLLHYPGSGGWTDAIHPPSPTSQRG